MNARHALLLVVAAAFSPAAVGAQASYAAEASLDREGSFVTAATLRLPVGSSADQEGFEGSAWLLGRTLARQVDQALAPFGATVDVDVGRGRTSFTVTALPDRWPRVRAALERVLFQDPVDEELFASERRVLQEQLTFGAASPALAFEREAVAMLAPPSHPWSRPITGTPESVAAITTHNLELMRRSEYDPARAVLGTVLGGPRGPADSAAIAGGDRPVVTEGPGPEASVAWSTSDRVDLKQEVTSAWISVAYAVGSGDWTALTFVADVLGDVLASEPRDPALYSLDIELVDVPGGRALWLRAAVVPEAAERWERRIVDEVAELVASPPEREFFTWARRRFRSRTLLADTSPSAASRRAAEDLARAGTTRELEAEIWALTEERVAEALARLGATRIFVLGPDLGLNGR